VSAVVAALEIENQALRIRIDPRTLRADLRDRGGALVLEGLRPALAGDSGAALPARGARVHAVGEVRGPTGPADRVEMQVWKRRGIGLRWIVEMPRDEPGVAASLCVENRGSQAIRLDALHPLSIEASDGARISLASLVASVRLPLTENRDGGEPLESLLLLDLGGGLCGLFGFTTARLAWTRWELGLRGAEATHLQAVNALGGRTLPPGGVIESDRAWLAVGPDRGALLMAWARRTGLEMDSRVPRRGAATWSPPRRSDRLQGLQPDGIHVIDGQATTDVPSYRSRLAEARERLESGALLVASNAPFGASVGLADARSVNRNAPPGARDLDLAFTNQRLWLLAPGPLRVGDGSLEEARTRASIAGLAGGLLTLADDIDTLSDERFAVLQRILPTLAREAHAPPARGILVTPLVGGRLAVLLSNPGAERADLALPFRVLGRRGPFHGFDFWENQPLGLLHDGIPVRGVEPGGCRVIGLTPPSDRVQVVGSSLHIGMGTLEVASLRPLSRSRHVLSLRLAGTHRGDVWISEPQSTTARRVPVAFSDAAVIEIGPAGQ
jgi:hypothetical protein